MNTGTKLGAYGLVLAAALGGGAAVGGAAGPIDVGDSGDHGGGHAEAAPTSDLPAGGLVVAQDGYVFRPDDRLADAGNFSFTITGPDGHPVEDFAELHDRELHLIVASRDLETFTHLHPERDSEGRWTVDLPELPAGSYRAFADFQPEGGTQLTLGVDLAIPGTVDEPADPRPTRSDLVGGFEATLDGAVAPGSESDVTVTVRRGGEVVTTDPYLGAAGHLVALRHGDLAYLHVHPLDDVPNGPVRFAVEVPSSGTYALFFDFVVDGDLHTARFVVAADGVGADGGTTDGH